MREAEGGGGWGGEPVVTYVSPSHPKLNVLGRTPGKMEFYSVPCLESLEEMILSQHGGVWVLGSANGCRRVGWMSLVRIPTCLHDSAA